MLPWKADPIVAARAVGKRPAKMIVVADGSDCMGWQNPTVIIDPRRRPSEYDFAFLAGLDVEVATRADARRSVLLANALIHVSPNALQIHWLDDDSILLLIADGDRRFEIIRTRYAAH